MNQDNLVWIKVSCGDLEIERQVHPQDADAELERLVRMIQEKQKTGMKNARVNRGKLHYVRDLGEFLMSPRGLGEIETELKRRGRPIKKGTLSSILFRMVKKGEIERTTEDGRYKYFATNLDSGNPG